MEVNEIKKPLVEHLSCFNTGLDEYTLHRFRYKKEAEVWSLCQLYDHITISNSYFFMANTVRCIEERKGQVGGSKEIQGEWVIRYNSMNDGRFKGPSGSQQPCAGGDDPKAHYGNLLKQNIADVEVIADRLLAGYNPNYKCRHPLFGWFNALEWFQVMEIHVRHHLRQKKELEEFSSSL